MSAGAQKAILVTSLVWAAAIAGVLLFFHYRPLLHPAQPADSLGPLAAGPAASNSSAANVLPGQMDAPLASIQLTADRMRNLGVTTGTAEWKDLDNDLRATGSVAIDESRVSYVQVRFSGSIRKVFADATYQYVQKGQPLFTIYSPELVATEQEYLLANENQRALSSSSIRDVAAGARSLATAAERRLEQWDIPASEIAALKRSGKVISDLTIQSPASGYITERNALPDTYAEPSTRLYTIADLSRVWVNAQVFQCDVGRLKPGDRATITVDAYPQKTFSGSVQGILPLVDAATRTVQVRLSIDNTGLLLKPGMFVNVGLKSAMGRRLVVPASSVLQTGLRQVVFLFNANGRIEPHEIVLGPRVDDDFVVLKGLQPHQRIVTSANFLIDSESQLQASSSANTEPAPSSAVNEASASQSSIGIEVATTPDPPRKGSNALRVKLAGSNGSPISGADVELAFDMAAMPEMGMAAMHASAKLIEKSSGLYQNTAELPSAGTWQVTVTVRQHGQLVAAKKFNVLAKGGM